jgi:hypothetical protein
MRRSHLQLLPAADAGSWPAGAVCRRFDCAAEAIELGLCAQCLARYRSQRRVDEARLAALTRQLIRRPGALVAGWPAALKPPACPQPGRPAALGSPPRRRRRAALGSRDRNPRRHPRRIPEAPIGLRRLPRCGQLGSKARSLVTPRHRLGAAPLRAQELAALAPAALLLAAGPPHLARRPPAAPPPARRRAGPPTHGAGLGQADPLRVRHPLGAFDTQNVARQAEILLAVATGQAVAAGRWLRHFGHGKHGASRQRSARSS